MAKVRFARGAEADALALEYQDGQLVVAKDTGRLWLDADGERVELGRQGADGAVKSVNGIEPDADGNVEIEVSTAEGVDESRLLPDPTALTAEQIGCPVLFTAEKSTVDDSYWLLYPFYEDMADHSNYALASEAYGGITLQDESPDGTGRSVYFNGSSCVHGTLPGTIGTGDFTVEFWMMMPSSASLGHIFSTRSGNSSSSECFGFQVTADGALYVWTTYNAVEPGASLDYGVWHHAALVRRNGVMTIYLNGKTYASAACDSNFTRQIFAWGAGWTGSSSSEGYHGYLCNAAFRNYAVYTEEFAVEYAPITSLTEPGYVVAKLPGASLSPQLAAGDVEAKDGDWLIFTAGGAVTLPEGSDLAQVKVTCETSDGVNIYPASGDKVAGSGEGLEMDLSGVGVLLQYRASSSNWKPVEIYQASPLALGDDAAAAIPEDGLVFCAMLEDLTTTTGQTLTNNGVSFESDSTLGRMVAYFDGGSNIAFSLDNMPLGTTPHTKSMWIKWNGDIDQVYALAWGKDGGNSVSTIAARSNHWYWAFSGNWDDTGVSIELGAWLHVATTHDGSGVNKLYVNGSLAAMGSRSLSVDEGNGVIGSFITGTEKINAWVSSIRVYSRVLDDDEIAALAAEYSV